MLAERNKCLFCCVSVSSRVIMTNELKWKLCFELMVEDRLRFIHIYLSIQRRVQEPSLESHHYLP